MNQGILFRYSPISESEEAQLVVPIHERQEILKIYHDAPKAGHYGSNEIFERISKRYYWTAKSLQDSYVHPRILNFLRLPIDLIESPLPESPSRKKWIFIVEDCCTRWVQLFVLTQGTARECATTLIEEVILRYGLPTRRLISSHGSQFVGAVLQQLCFILNIIQDIIHVYRPQANRVERNNCDLKPRIAILIQSLHD
ncbi:transposon Ty3-I Gag-Pol polyprotein [Trichonephila clavipes]|nr:transposon Ty3-I Gag-Pol polyprotein [Trichonephila clavipes]